MKSSIYKRYFISYLFFIAFALCSIMTFNFYIDPANFFFNSHSFESKLANILLSNKDAMIRNNYNDRSFHKLMIEKLQKRPEVLVLGSSHTMPIRHIYFKDLSLYNASVSSATLEDDLALYYVYQKRGWQPDIAVICLDPWILDRNFFQFRMLNSWKGQWKSTLSLEYHNARKLILGNVSTQNDYDRITGLFYKYSQLLSFDYFIASIKQTSLFITLNPAATQQNIISPPDSTSCLSCQIRHPDGSRTPSKYEESLSVDEVNASALSQIQNLQDSFGSYKDYSKLDSDYTNILEQFVRYLINHKVKVIFYFPPLEPLAYTELVANNPSAKEVAIAEQYFVYLASKYRLETIGSYQASKLGLQESDFIDSWHLKEKGSLKILNARQIKSTHSLSGHFC